MTPRSLRFRDAMELDLVSLSVLLTESFRGTDLEREWTVSALSAHLHAPGGKILVAIDPVSRRTAAVAVYLVHGTDASVLALCTDPNFRRCGVGSSALSETIARSEALGATTVTLEVDPKNLAATDLYRRLGFVALGHRLGYYTPDAPALFMARSESDSLFQRAKARYRAD